MKHFNSKLSIIFAIILSLISFGAFKNATPINQEIHAPINLNIDSLQVLIDTYVHTKESDKKKKEFQKLIARIQSYTSSINGSRAIVFRRVKYLLFVANMDSDDIQMHLYQARSSKKNLFSLGAVKKELEEEKRQALMITNAGMFTPDFEPEGLYIEEKSKYFFALDTGRDIPNANFYLKPNGAFYLDAKHTAHIDGTEILMLQSNRELRNLKLATQSGPLLVSGGEIHHAFKQGSKNLRIRSGVGLEKNNQKKIVFALTRNESNFYDFALFFRDIFNCDNALFLDGAISQMYLFDLNAKELGGQFGPMISVSRKRSN